MKSEQIQKVIAEICGFEWDGLHETYSRIENGRRVWYNDIPNYAEDLNACRDAWTTLGTKELRITFHHKLQEAVVKGGGHAASLIIDVECCVENATAHQRCEAFIKTICPERWVDQIATMNDKQKITVSRDFCLYKCPKEDLISREIVEQRRWDISHEIIFKKDGRFWRAYYDTPATECQDGQEYDEQVEAEEVFTVEKMVIVYE